QVRIQHDPQHAGDLLLAARVDHGVDDAGEVTVAGAEQVRQGPAEGVQHPELVVIAQVLGPDHVGQRLPLPGPEAGGGHLVVSQLRFDRVRLRGQVQADLLLRQRGEGRLVAPVEGDVVQAPAPPLVALDLARARRCTHAVSSSSGLDCWPPRISSWCWSYRPSTRSRIRAVNSTADSPSDAITGSPNTTASGGRPRFGQPPPMGIASWAPMMAAGITGTPTPIASAAAPGLNSPSVPVIWRPPSGNTRIGTPECSRRREVPECLREPPRSIGKALNSQRTNQRRY